MPFPHDLTASELVTIRTGGYRASVNLAYCPQTTVFAARVNGAIGSGVFAQVVYDTVTVGAFGDCEIDQTVYISTSSSIRDAYLTTYVRKAPTSTILYIGESASVIADNDYIIVVNDYALREHLVTTSGTTVLINRDVTFKKPAPLIGNLQSAYINPVSSGSATFTFSPTGYPLAHDATTTLTWLWDVADGTITVGTTTTQEITASFPQGERWVRVTVTDSNGVTNYRVFWVSVGLTYTIQNIGDPPISGSLEDGWNVSLDTWDFQGATILRSLSESTLVVIYTAEIFGDGSTTPVVTNIDFIGRTRSERSTTAGDEQWSTIQTGAFEVEGFGSQLNRLSSPAWAFRHNAAPSQWGEMNRPTVPRFIGQMCTLFNTLSNLCSLHFDIPFTYRATTTSSDATVTVASTTVLVPGMGVSGTGIPGGATVLSITDKTTFELSANATATGTNTLVFTPASNDQDFVSQSLTITDTSAGAALDRIAKWINAGLDYAQSGEIEIRRHAFYRTAAQKNALVSVADWTGGDPLEYTLDIDYPESVGRVFTGAEAFNTTLLKTSYITGSAPPVARGNGEGEATEDGQVLTVNSTPSALITEQNARTAALYADSQPKDKLEVLFYDALRGILVPSRSRWHTHTIASSNNIMGRAYTTSQRWICSAVNYNITIESGEVANRATFLREPTVGSAQVASAISPDLIEPAIPDLLAFNPYPAFKLSGSINYPYDGIPAAADLQPIDSYSASLGDELAANNFPPAGCLSYTIMLNDSTGVTTPALTNGATYTVRVSGSGEIAASSTYNDAMTAGLAAGTAPASGYAYMTWCDGDVYTTPCLTGNKGGGWIATEGDGGGGSIRGEFIDRHASGADVCQAGCVVDLGAEQTITDIAISYKASVAGPSAGDYHFRFFDDAFVEVTPFLGGAIAVLASYQTQTSSGFTRSGVRYVSICLVCEVASGADFIYIDNLIITYSGGGNDRADAFYGYNPATPGTGTPLGANGLKFDGSDPVTIPPYNTNHVYETTIAGDGTTQVIKFQDASYGNNEATALIVQICGDGL